jgi:hypothetical protein
MKIQFLRDITVDIEKTRLQEIWDKSFRKWDEVTVEDVCPDGNVATIQTREGDFILDVPFDAFKIMKEDPRPALFL